MLQTGYYPAVGCFLIRYFHILYNLYCAQYNFVKYNSATLQTDSKIMANDCTSYLELREQVCFPVYALSRAIIGHYRPLLDELGITYPQYLVMLLLWEQEPQTVGQLCTQLHLDNGTITPLLKRLEQNGLVLRTRSKTDERVVEIALTPEGTTLRQRAESVPAKMLESMGLTHEELSQLKQIAGKILQKACAGPENVSLNT